jgi:hypothetical protein
MCKTVLFLLLLASGWSNAAQGAPTATNSVADGRVLILENSTMPLPAAKATLTDEHRFSSIRTTLLCALVPWW